MDFSIAVSINISINFLKLYLINLKAFLISVLASHLELHFLGFFEQEKNQCSM